MEATPAPARVVREAVASADARRRSAARARHVAHLALAGAAVVLLVAAGAWVFRWPRASVGVAAGLAVIIVAVRFWLLGRAVEATDATAARVDAAAGLNGELRSAHWFAAQRAGEAGGEAGQMASGWAAFHVAQAAERATAVDWQRLYPAPRTARLWTATAALSIAALALSIGLAPVHFTTLTGLAARGGERRAADATGAIATRKATALSPELARVLAGLKSGTLSADELRAAADRLAKLAEADPTLEQQIEDLLADDDATADGSAAFESHDASGEATADGSMKPALLSGAARWALEDLEAQVAVDTAQAAKSEDDDVSEQGAAGGAAPDSNTPSGPPSLRKTDKPGPAGQMTRESVSGAGAQMMAGGRGAEGGDATPVIGGHASQAVASLPDISAVLSRELVEANADAKGDKTRTGELRRQTAAGRSTLGFTGAAAADADRSRALPPPPIPEARRLLLEQYFVRPPS